MASAAYAVLIDLGKDETYAHPLANVTYYTVQARFSYGVRNAFDEFAPQSQLTLTLDNASGAFDPEDTGALFYGLIKRGLLVRINATTSVSTYGLYVGRIRELRYDDMGFLGERSLTLTVTDFMDDLLFRQFDAPLATDALPGGVIRDIFERAGLVYPYASKFLYLDQGYSLDDPDKTIFASGALTTGINNGISVISWVGDKPNSSIQGYFRDLVAAELGGLFFYAARAGIFAFLDRHWAVGASTAITLDDTEMDDVVYYADRDVINDVTVSYYPRRVGTAASVLWTIGETVALAPKQVRTISARYSDPQGDSGASVGGVNMILPQAQTDYIAREDEDGGGLDYTGFLRVSTTFTGTSANLTIENASPTLTIYVTKLQVRGTPLISSREDQVHAFSGASQIKYGILSESYDFALVDNAGTAQAFANTVIARFADPMPRVDRVSFTLNKNETRMQNGMTQYVGQVIRIDSARLNHDRLYMIVGEQHNITGGGDSTHEVTWILRPADFYNYAQLDVSSLDTNAPLAI